MTPETLINIFGLFNFWGLVKLFALVLFFFYFVLSLVIVRQTDLMNQVLGEEGVSPVLRLVTLVHLVAVGFLFFLAVIFI